MNFNCQMFSLGQEEFTHLIELRTGYRGETQFVDFTGFLPEPLIPPALRSSMFREAGFTMDQARKTVKWFAYLYFHSVYVDGFTTEGNPTTTSKQRQWRFYNNILLFKDFVQTFCLDDGKLQIEKCRTLRACLDREGCWFESYWASKSVLGPDRIKSSLEKVDISIYRDRLFGIIHREGIHKRRKKEELRRIWLAISRNYAPSYPYLIANSLAEAAAKTHLTDTELRNELESHFSKKPLHAISQCGDLRGRTIEFVNGDSYVSFKACAQCDHNRDGQVLRVPDEEQLCRRNALTPLGEDLNRWTRNNFTSQGVRASIIKRDQNVCVVGKNIPIETCKGSVVMGHVVSALYTRHPLTIYDGLCLCELHNGRMNTRDLLDAFPKLRAWTTANHINVRGKNLDLIEWP